MGWTRKEKPLSPEEAIAFAKKELAAFWFNSEPLIALIKTATGAAALPLSPEYTQTAWLYFFVDAGEYLSEASILLAKEFYRRYHSHRINLLLVLKPTSIGMKGASDLVRRYQLSFPVVIDQESLFAAAFNIKKWPAYVLQGAAKDVQGGGTASGSDSNWMSESYKLEEQIQNMLRVSDPGLALPLSFKHIDPREIDRVDLGSQGEPNPKIRFIGKWTEGEDFMRTEDSTGAIEIYSPGSRVSMIARSNIETQPVRIVIEGTEEVLSKDSVIEPGVLDEGGKLIYRVQGIAFYHLLKSLSATKRRVCLSFPDSETNPIIIYGFRFAE